MIEAYNINDIHSNDANPRFIKDSKFEQLVKSIREFPDMTMVRPLIINQDNMILGGNQRFMAMKELGFTTVPCQKVDWSAERQREFLIRDNTNYGSWDWDALANDFDADGACGACCPGFVGNIGAGGAIAVPGVLLDCLSLICCKYFLFFSSCGLSVVYADPTIGLL